MPPTQATRAQTISVSPLLSGSPLGATNINAGAEVNSTNGYIFTSGTGASLNNWIAYQSSYTVNTSAYGIQDISFYAGSTALTGFGTPGARVAVEIDGNWYVTTQVFSNDNSVASGSNFHLAPRQWRSTTGDLHLDNRRQCLGFVELRPG